MPIFLPEKDWDKQFFSIKECNINQEILKTKKRINTLFGKSNSNWWR